MIGQISRDEMRSAIEDKLCAHFGTTGSAATDDQVFQATAIVLREIMSRFLAAEDPHHAEIGSAVLQSDALDHQLPEQISDIIRMTMSGQTKVNLDVTGSEEPLRQLDKMINKVVLTVLCAALLMGSSTICTTNMTPKVMEIPLLGVVGYLLAFILSIRIIWDIYRKK